jgi:ABC-type transporter Mla subunit MlaD
VTTPQDEPKRLSFRSATKPITDYFDRRFTDLHQHLDHRLDELEARLDRLEALVGGLDGAQRVEAAAAKADRFDELSRRLQRFADEFAARAERIASAYEAAARPRDGG